VKVELDLARERELWLEMGKQVERITEGGGGEQKRQKRTNKTPREI